MSQTSVNPDGAWQFKNSDYEHNNWYSTPDGSWETRVNNESAMDTFSGLNWNKMPIRTGEYYSNSDVPLVDSQWDEEEYWNNVQSPKSEEEFNAELDEGRLRLQEKIDEFEKNGQEVMCSPTMYNILYPEVEYARKLEYKLSPFFQLNQYGFRKNWANTRLCEMRPFTRFFGTNFPRLAGDYVIRFQLVRNSFTSKYTLRWWKAWYFGGLLSLTIGQVWASEYRRKWKWH